MNKINLGTLVDFSFVKKEISKEHKEYLNLFISLNSTNRSSHTELMLNETMQRNIKIDILLDKTYKRV